MKFYSQRSVLERRVLWLLIASFTILGLTLLARWGQVVSLASPDPEPEVEAVAPAWTTTDTIIRLQDQLRLNPEDTAAYAQLGLAFLQQVRETGDAALYLKAEKALNEALQREPQHFEAILGQGLLALARHDFEAALVLGEQAKAINPHRVQVYGIIGDAQIELGRYDDALQTIQTMVDTRPELSSYSRVSYIRELHGDTSGAITAMEQAVGAGGSSEAALWTQVQLGHLYFNRGDLDRAEQEYLKTLHRNPDYVYALAGLGKIWAARGEGEMAIEAYETIVERIPLPKFVITLGELYEITDQPKAAQQQYDLVQAIEQLNATAGMNVDLELALFKANHALDPAQTLKQARAAYQQRPSIYGADVLAWALYQNGEYAEAQRLSQEALRLGARDAMLYYHAGMIAYALDDLETAHQHLQQALTINPYFSLRYAPQAKVLLQELSR